jgi:hypothetical protein
MEQSDHIALDFERISVRNPVCCCTLFNERLTVLTLFSVCVNHGSTWEASTTLTFDLGVKAAAEVGSNEIGIVCGWYLRDNALSDGTAYQGFKEKNKTACLDAHGSFEPDSWERDDPRDRAAPVSQSMCTPYRCARFAPLDLIALAVMQGSVRLRLLLFTAVRRRGVLGR